MNKMQNSSSNFKLPFGKALIVPVVPIGKPRMTRRDKWLKRPATDKYWSFGDELRALLGIAHKLPSAPANVSWTAYFPMPQSWSKKKQQEMSGKPHQARPDRDNVDKAVLDSLFLDDSTAASGNLQKRWDDGKGARIEIVLGE